jgi:hypothetical protein
MNKKILTVITATSVTAVCALGTVSATSPRFYRDDPIARAPEVQDAGGAAPSFLDLMYELTYNLFALPRHKPSGVRAQNINTIDEVPDSSWFTNRIGTRALTIDEIVRGPNMGAPPDPSHWVIWRQKTSGSHPGITAKDAKGETWFLEFDPPYYENGPSAAVVMNTKIYWALGYNQVESFITTFDLNNVTIDPEASFVRPNGKKTPITRSDLEELLELAARKPDGTYRVVAGRLISGKIVGNYRYQGTRPDDPNDLVPHENRRELRALGVFGAWTNVTDFKAENTIDALVEENGRKVIKHYLQDVGSSFGVCNDIHTWDVSWEYFVHGPSAAKRLASFGFALSPWQTVKYVEGPEIGKFEGDRFDPREWRGHTPNAAVMEMRDDDAFWAAQRVAAFTPEMIRAIVHTGEFSDPASEKAIGDIVLKRREKILRAYLPAVNPIVSPKLADGRLTFENAAVDADVAVAPEGYIAKWFDYDNATDETRPIGATSSKTTVVEVPDRLPTRVGSFVAIDLSANARDYPDWMKPVRAYFRLDASGWKLVGLDRIPDGSTKGAESRQATR